MCEREGGEGRETPSDRLLPLDRDGCQHFLLYYAISLTIFPIISVSFSLSQAAFGRCNIFVV